MTMCDEHWLWQTYECVPPISRTSRLTDIIESPIVFADIELFVYRVVACMALNDSILALSRSKMVFVAQRTAHVARVCTSDQIREFQFVQKGDIRFAHIFVSISGLFFCCVESIKIFHQELSAAQKALPWSWLITVLS